MGELRLFFEYDSPPSYLCFLFRSFTDIIDLADYTKDEHFSTIKRLAVKGIIDTVYVRFADESHDRGYDCSKPSNMKGLKYIIVGDHPRVLGWRLHNHKREAKNIAVAKSIMIEDEI